MVLAWRKRGLTANVVGPGCFAEDEEVVYQDYDVDGLVDEEIVPCLGYEIRVIKHSHSED